MSTERHENYGRLYPGEWIAVSQGTVIAHGHDFCEVAQEACDKATDISFDHVPDPRAPLWQAATPIEPPRRRRLLLGQWAFLASPEHSHVKL